MCHRARDLRAVAVNSTALDRDSPLSHARTPGRNVEATGLVGRTAEVTALAELLAAAREGHSGVLVLRGEAGIGKSALLDLVTTRAEGFDLVRVVGVDAEMELPYAGLQQLCRPFLDRLPSLPEPQRAALATAFGLGVGPPPDRFLVGLAVLQLLAGLAEQQPVLWIVDDAQWLDRLSIQTLAFVARRLLAESVVLLMAARDTPDHGDLAGLPELRLQGLSSADGAVLLGSVLAGPTDPRVWERILAESHGNPLALLELPWTWTTAELVDGLAEPSAVPAVGKLEDGFATRLRSLPADSRLLLTLAAAEPLGDPTLLWDAAERLGLGWDAAGTAEAAGLIEFGANVRFRHPMVRAAAYRAASTRERLDAHHALAEATDPIVDPDRRAWHRANATVTKDDEIATELECSAGRARSRGGLLATSALLERAALLTTDPGRRADRTLSAAVAKRDAGAPEAALALLPAVEARAPTDLRRALTEHLRGQIAFDQRRGAEAARLLLSAATQLESINPSLARETYLEALAAAIWESGPEGDASVVAAARAASAAPPAGDSPRVVDLLLDALTARVTEGYAAAAPILTRAMAAVSTLEVGPAEVDSALWLAGSRAAGIIACELWDYEAGRALAERQVRTARDAGALVQLQVALNFLANKLVLAGDLPEAAGLLEEDRLVSNMTGVPPIPCAGMLLEAVRGNEERTSTLMATAAAAAAAGGRRILIFANHAAAVLHNGLGRHERAFDCARRVFEGDVLGYQTFALSELAEAASRTGNRAALEEAREWMSVRAGATPTGWARGIEARVKALASDGSIAEELYRESIALLGTTRLRLEVARGHLLYGEWLRRAGRRGDARDALRLARHMFVEMEASAFAERARRELLATGEKIRRRTAPADGSLTAQEAQIARLVKEGLTNPEIGTRLFLSARTVEWHLRNVFDKFGVSSRRQLRDTDLGAYGRARPSESPRA
jgi:DNA-binding CsgD family transcriptional regulator